MILKSKNNNVLNCFFKYVHVLSTTIVITIGCSYCEIKSGKCEPYYLSIKSGNVNSHVGPGKNYKILYTYTLRGLPIKVIAKYDHWRKIIDPDGTESWIHKSLLSTKRFVIVVSYPLTKLMSESNDSSTVVARLKRNVIMELLSVRGNWCKVKTIRGGGKYIGWIKKLDVFGVSDDENW